MNKVATRPCRGVSDVNNSSKTLPPGYGKIGSNPMMPQKSETIQRMMNAK